jgi:multidrug resistance protein, MATE family
LNKHDNHTGSRVRRRDEVRHVIVMSIPVVITMSSRAVMDIADYVLITWLRLPEAQAAILPAQVIMWSYIILGLGVATVVSTFASQSLGRGEPRECSAYAWHVIYISLFFGVVGYFCRPLLWPLIEVIGHEPAVQEQELAYAGVALLTVAPTIAANGLGWFFVGIHRPWITMWSAIEANIVNVLVSYVLMFGVLGHEPMGIAGAAWGTLVAVTYRTIRLTAGLLTPSMASAFHSLETWRPSWTRIRNFFRVGAPFGLQSVCEVMVWAIFVNVLIGRRFSTADLIATNTAWQYMRFAFFPAFGVGHALTALVGKSVGAGDPQRAIRESRIAVGVTVIYMGGLSLVYALFGRALVGLFSSDPVVLDIGEKVMLCAAAFQLFDALGIVYSCALRGAGDTFVPAIIMIASLWLVVVGGGWAMTEYWPQWGSLGPWMAAATLFVATSLMLWWRWHSRAWMKIDVFRSAPTDGVESPAATSDISASLSQSATEMTPGSESLAERS